MVQAGQQSSAIATQLAPPNGEQVEVVASRFARNPQFSATQASFNGRDNLPIADIDNITKASQLAVSSAKDVRRVAAQIAAENPRLSQQQAALVAGEVSSEIASGLTAATPAGAAAIAAQYAAKYPSLSDQQAALQANYESTARASQGGLPYLAYPDQGDVYQPRAVGMPGYYAATYTNGAYQSTVPAVPTDDGGAVDGVAQTAPGAALQGMAQLAAPRHRQNLLQVKPPSM